MIIVLRYTEVLISEGGLKKVKKIMHYKLCCSLNDYSKLLMIKNINNRKGIKN